MKRIFQFGFVLVIAVLLVTSSLFAQRASFNGVITDKDTGERLAGANVQLESIVRQTRGIATDDNGGFRIENIPEGKYTLTVSYVGYGRKTVTDLEFISGESKSMNFDLLAIPLVANQVIISASRRQEKVLDAPASVVVLESEKIVSHIALTPAEHVQALPGVDIVRSGLTQANIVARGFNNVFSTTLMSIVDNRIARVPSLRVNVYNFIPTTSDDIERVEVVLGPGSALYGPNTANGVMHMITKSPFDSEGTNLNIAGGERSVMQATFRHAKAINEKVAFKISGEYYQGNEWEYIDPVEKATRESSANPGKIGLRDFDISKMSGEARLDYRANDDLTMIFNGGFNKSSDIVLTGLGAGQAQDWTYGFGQARVLYKDFFFQTFFNKSDAGDTYLLRSGEPIVDKSTLAVTQAQHKLNIGDWQNLTYGVDLLLTNPVTENTINGRNEDEDNMREIGVYVQSDTKLNDKFNFVMAGRYDDHDHLQDPFFSPRAALVFKPAADHTFRVTFNRAFSTPSNNNLFLDLLSSPATAANPYGVRVYGSKNGFNFQRDGNGGIDGLYMQSPFTLDPTSALPYTTNPNAFLPADAASMWASAIKVMIGATGNTALAGLIPFAPNSSQVGTVLRALNTTTLSFDEVGPEYVQNIRPIESTKTNTLEFGYKGVMNSKILFTADFYYSKITDFVGPLRVESPNVFFNPAELGAYLSNPAFGLDAATIGALTAGMASLPVGTIKPIGSTDPIDMFLTYRNFGEIELSGADISLGMYFNKNWNFSAYASLVSKDYFTEANWPSPIALNSPKKKLGASLQYKNYDNGFEAMTRFRFTDAFPVNSGVFIGEIDEYALLDVNLGYKLPVDQNVKLTLTIQNMLDNRHYEMIGAPEIGRLSLMRLSYGF